MPDDSKTEKTTSEQAGDPAAERLTAGKLREMIRDEITSIAGTLFKGPGQSPSTGDSPKPTQAQTETDVRLEVGRALSLLRSKEARDERDRKVDELLAERAAAKPTPETPPVERRRVEKWMRWE